MEIYDNGRFNFVDSILIDSTYWCNMENNKWIIRTLVIFNYEAIYLLQNVSLCFKALIIRANFNAFIEISSSNHSKCNTVIVYIIHNPIFRISRSLHNHEFDLKVRQCNYLWLYLSKSRMVTCLAQRPDLDEVIHMINFNKNLFISFITHYVFVAKGYATRYKLKV